MKGICTYNKRILKKQKKILRKYVKKIALHDRLMMKRNLFIWKWYIPFRPHSGYCR